MDVNQKINKFQWPVWIFAILWFVFITLDYVNKHPAYFSSVEYFQYPVLYSFLVLLFGAVYFILKSPKWKFYRPPVNGLTITLLLAIISFAIIVSHKDYAYTPTDLGQVFHFFTSAWLLIIFMFIIIMVMGSVGRVFYRRLLKKYINPNPVLDIAIGIMVFCVALFVAAALGLFMQNVIIALLFIFALVNLLYLVKSIKEFFIKPIEIEGLSWLGILSFCFLIFFLMMHFLANYAPYPSGFDSRNFYMNISKMMAMDGHLVEGYQPYYWSIFMGIGYSLFSKVELALELSYLGMLLVLLAGFRFGVKRLKLDTNIVLFCLLIFSVTPAIVNQMYTELKVDFAMLFYQVLCLEYVLILLKRLRTQGDETNLKTDIKVLLPLTILIGVLSSFALGIKMINMFMVFTIFILFWWHANEKAGLSAALSFTLLLFLFAGIDDLSGLDKYHLAGGPVKIVLALIVVGGFAYSFIKARKIFIKKAILSAVFLASTGLLILPWVGKHYSETKSLSPTTLLMGKNPGPGLTVKKIISNYEKSGKN